MSTDWLKPIVILVFGWAFVLIHLGLAAAVGWGSLLLAPITVPSMIAVVIFTYGDD